MNNISIEQRYPLNTDGMFGHNLSGIFLPLLGKWGGGMQQRSPTGTEAATGFSH